MAPFEPYYRVDVTIGAHSWSVLSTDTPDYGPADPMVVEWSCPDNGVTFPHPAPMRLQLNIVTATAGELADLKIGDPVVARMWAWPPGTLNPYGTVSAPLAYDPVVVFRGRVAAVPTARPHKLGVVWALTCLDYTADLVELTAGTVDYPAEVSSDRLMRIFEEAAGPTALAPLAATTKELAARAAAPDRLLAMATKILDTVAGPTARHYIGPNYLSNTTSDAPDLAYKFAIRSNTKRITTVQTSAPYAPYLPGLLAITSPGKYGPTISEEAHRLARILDAGKTDFDASWRLTKGDNPDTVAVEGPFTTGDAQVVVAGAAPLPVQLTIKTDLTDPGDAEDLASFYLVSPDSDGWVADSFTFFADLDPHVLLFPTPLFNDAYAYNHQMQPVVLNGIEADRNPTGDDWYAGQLVGATLTLRDGRYSVVFKVRRNLPSADTSSSRYLAHTTLAAAPYAGLTHADLDRSFSYFDYRLLRDS